MDAQIGEVMRASSVIAAKKHIELSTAGRAGVARAEPGDVGRILTNLIANAVKFTPEGGSVTVTSSADDATITVVVADTGPGMSEETLAHAFDRFYRAPGMQRDAVPGTGLGLAIVAELVERNEGSVRLASPPPAAPGRRSSCRGACRRRGEAQRAGVAILILRPGTVIVVERRRLCRGRRQKGKALSLKRLRPVV
ncbi:sensor histidine kinase [Leifsonia sp. L25]|uniref:sensor histidine kinase n=1 Tax=Leifsonia sp. L25 TaxID=3423957 RepID=UPI003D694A14